MRVAITRAVTSPRLRENQYNHSFPTISRSLWQTNIVPHKELCAAQPFLNRGQSVDLSVTFYADAVRRANRRTLTFMLHLTFEHLRSTRSLASFYAMFCAHFLRPTTIL